MTSLTPQSPRLNSLVQTLAEAYLERGQYAEAAEKFSELVRSGLQTPNVYRNLALSLLGMESASPAAQQVYQYVLKNFSNDRELSLQICALLLKQRAHDAFALKCFQQTLALSPPPPREMQWALALHLEGLGYEPAAFEILKRLALLENGAEPQTLAQLLQLAPRLDKQSEARNILLYLEGRNEHAHGVARFLALDYARVFLREDLTPDLTTREWQSITQTALGYERLEDLQAAREYALLRLALARLQQRNAQRLGNASAPASETRFNDFIQRLTPLTARAENANELFTNLYGLRLRNLARIRAESGENVARNLAQKFLTFAARQFEKVASASCFLFADGFLASVTDLYALAQTAIDLLHKVERYNLTAAKGTQLFVQTVVHRHAANASLEKLRTLYETLNLLAASSADESMGTEQRNRLWFPRAMYEREGDVLATPTRTPQEVYCAAEEYRAEVCEAVWRNPLEYVEEKTPYDLKRFVVSAKLRPSRWAGTYRGRDRQLERNVIIKALGPHASLQLAQDDTQREHVLATIRRLAQLESPGIATIYDMGFHDEIFFYAREHLEGKTLAATRAERQLSFPECVKLALRLCRILAVAHRQGVLHGNLKPENIWLFANEEIKLSDFYVPLFVAAPEVALRMQTTSWHYAAPEFLQAFAPSVVSEVYAIGILLFELTSGAQPFAGITSIAEWQAYELPSLIEYWPEAPPGFPELIARACAKSPEPRFPNLLALENALRLFA